MENRGQADLYRRTFLSTVAAAASVSAADVGTGAVTRSSQNTMRGVVSVKDFGATGDGVTDDTTAIQAALTTSAAMIVGWQGAKFLTGPLTSTIAGRTIDMAGSTMKLKPASSGALLTVSGAGSVIRGGTWDNNSIAQSGVVVSASYCVVEGITSQNNGAAGIYIKSNAQHTTIKGNIVKDAVTYGIYVECLASDCYGNKIIDNIVDTSATAAADGIYLTGSNTPFKFKQRQWQIRGNRCNGSLSSPTGVGIVARANDGICSGNHVVGYTIGISMDISARSVVSANRVEGPAGGAAYCMEVNGGHNTISANVTKGGAYGIIGSGPVVMDHNTITGNQIENPTNRGIYFVPSSGNTANFLSIVGNNIDMSGGSAGAQCIDLSLDCRHSNIEGNTLRGRGSGTSGTRAVYINTPPAAAFISIIGNKLVGFERAFALYSAAALTVSDLTATGNDLSSDVSQSSVGWSAEGSAVIGARVNLAWGKDNGGGTTHVIDMANNVFILWSASYNNPNSNLTAGIGSIFYSLNSAGGAWYKAGGANTNTGWIRMDV